MIIPLSLSFPVCKMKGVAGLKNSIGKSSLRIEGKA